MPLQLAGCCVEVGTAVVLSVFALPAKEWQGETQII
jgi:hypothetical protein